LFDTVRVVVENGKRSHLVGGAVSPKSYSFAIIIYYLALLNAVSPSAFAQSSTSPAMVPRLAQLAYPGAQVDANNQAYLMVSDGQGNLVRKDITTTDAIVEQTSSGGTVVVAAFEITVDQNSAVNTIESYLPQAVIPSQAIIAIGFVDVQGNITASKVGKLDTAAATHVVELYWPNTASDGVFPTIQIAYQAWYGGTDWYGSVRWGATVDTSTMAIVSRVPTLVEKNRKSGSASSDILVLTPADNGNITISGMQSGSTFTYPCPGNCIVDAAVLLNNW